MKALVDTLWYVDGHHHVLKNRSHEVPKTLQHFTGYNVPESSKHRKRKVQNLSEGTTREFSNRLFTCLQGTYWVRSGWKDLKLDIQSLATLLSDYATYLREQNKKAKYLQSFAHPVRSIADNLDFRFLPRCETTPSLLTRLESRLAEKNEFEYVVVEDVCPSDPRRKYEYLQMLK